MEEGRALFDLSAYMLFEASGDSESQCGDAAFEPESDAPSLEAEAEADDDALSCSYGSRCGGARLHEVDAGGEDFRGADFEPEEDGGGSDEEDGVVNQCRRCETAAEEKQAKSSCEDINSKMMNEREGDRQFWEACLAS